MRLVSFARILFPILFGASLIAAPSNLQVDTKTHAVSATDGSQIMDCKAVTLTVGGFTIYDGAGVKTIVTGSTSGAMLGATGNKVGFLGATPIVRQTGNIFTALAAYGLVASPSLTIANVTSLQSSLDAKADSTALTSGLAGKVSTTTTVNGHALSGNVTVNKTDVALGNVDNTSDVNKPVSTAQQTALNLKANDNAAVHITGTESIAGAKSFTDPASFYSLASNSVVSSVLTTPGLPTVTPIGVSAATTWTYTVVAKLSDGSHTAAGPLGKTSVGDDVLDSTNKNSISWTAVTGAASYDVYRTSVGVSPSTTGKIATVTTNSYIDAGAAGDSSALPVFNTTGQVSGKVLDKGGHVFNVVAYGATGNGITDDTAAFVAAELAAATAGTGTVFAPAGVYRVNNFAMTHQGVNLEGAGKDSTIIGCNIDSAYVLRLGTANGAAFQGKISNLTITRDTGTVTSGVIGISAVGFGYAVIQDVVISRQGVGLKTSDGWVSLSLGLVLSRVQFCNSIIHCWLKDVAEIFINDSYFGVNGVETIAPTALVVFDGITNDVRISKTQFVPRITNTAAVFKWINNTSDNTGVYHFWDINIENIATVFLSDSTAALIQELSVSGSRLSPTAKLWDFHANTAKINFGFSNNAINSTASTITGATSSRFLGNQIYGSLTFDGGDWVVSGNTFNSDTHYTGTFTALSLANNTLVFNASSPVVLDVTGTGNITQTGNVSDAGTQPATVLPGDLSVTGNIIGVPFVKTITGISLKTIQGYNVFTVPAGKTYILISAYAELTTVAGYNSSVLPRIIIDGGPATDFLADSTADANYNAIGHVLPVVPSATGVHVRANAGQTVRALVATANTSITITARISLLGFYL